MKECKNCGSSHDGSYGSGDFCSTKCARSYSTKNKRSEINKKLSESLSGRTYPERGNNWTSETSDQVKDTWLKKILNTDFDELSFGSKRKVVLHEQDYKCNGCGISSWFDKPITLEVDHKDGISDNDSRENLEGLCPNCHSVTDTWRGRNKPSTNGGNPKVTDEELAVAIKESQNIRQALLSVGLAAKGNNYERAKKIKGL